MDEEIETRRPGFTITELMVSIAILGLLVAIIAPAVQSSRETARRLQCSNNLRQMGLAMANHVESHKSFPTSQFPEFGFWRMLPFLEQSLLLEEMRAFQAQTPPNPAPPQMNVPQFVCPSDTMHTVGFGNSNYLWNNGTKFPNLAENNGFRKSGSEDTSPSDISDGLSNTAAMSERLVSIPSFEAPPVDVMEREPRRYYWFTDVRYNHAGEESLAIDECRHRRTTVDPQFAGTYTQQYFDSSSAYTHLLTPNEAACYNQPEDFNIEINIFLVPPSSLHPNGVNILFADGSVHFVTNGISDEIWQAIGSRNGHEAETLSF